MLLYDPSANISSIFQSVLVGIVLEGVFLRMLLLDTYRYHAHTTQTNWLILQYLRVA